MLINPALSLWESSAKKLKGIVFLGSSWRLHMWFSNYWSCSVCEVANCTFEPFWSGVWSHWGHWLLGIDVTEQSLGSHGSRFFCCAKVCGFCRTTGISHLAALKVYLVTTAMSARIYSPHGGLCPFLNQFVMYMMAIACNKINILLDSWIFGYFWVISLEDMFFPASCCSTLFWGFIQHEEVTSKKIKLDLWKNFLVTLLSN